MATKKKPETMTVRLTRRLPATMLRGDADAPDYGGPDVAPGSQRTLPAATAQRLVKAGHAEEV